MATDLTATSATGNSAVVTSASYVFTSRDEGHFLYQGGGTNWTKGLYPIASTSGGAATLNTTAGAGYLVDSGLPYEITTTAGIATVASPTGGTWAIDYSQGTPISFTDLVIVAPGTGLTSAAKPMGKNFIGNIFNVTSGSGFTVQRVQVVSVSGVTATVDKSAGTPGSTGGTATFGGPFVSPGRAGGQKIAGNTVFVGPGTYTCHSSTNTAGGGVVDSTTGTASAPNFWIGYNTKRHINCIEEVWPRLNATSNGMNLMSITGTTCYIRNFAAGRAASQTSVVGFSMAGSHNCIENFEAFSLATGLIFTAAAVNDLAVDGLAESCTQGFTHNATIGGNKCHGCVAKLHTNYGFGGFGYNDVLSHCIAYGGIGATCDGFRSTGNGPLMTNCTAYGNGRHGFSLAGAAGFRARFLINCVATGNAARQFHQETSTELAHRLLACAFKADGVGTHDVNVCQLTSCVTLTQEPFTNAAGGEFSPNNSELGGELLKEVAFPTFFRGTNSPNYKDIGAVQHACQVVAIAITTICSSFWRLLNVNSY